MALLMFEGFENYRSGFADFALDMVSAGPWATTTNPTRETGETRTGAVSLKFLSNSSSYSAQSKSFPLAGTVGVLGFGFGIAHSSTEGSFLHFRDAAEATLCKLSITGDTVELKNASGAVLASLGAHPDIRAGYVYIELKVDFAVSGSLVARVNGAEVANVTGIDTTSGNGAFDHFWLSGVTMARYDDIYLCDDSGTRHNDFLGPVRVLALRPDSDASVAWTPDSGVTNYTQVDDSYPDADSTYVSTSTVNDKDLYGLEDLGAAYQDPQAVQLFWSARHDDGSGGAGIATVIKSGITEQEGGQVALGSTYVTRSEPMVITDPDTAAPWTAAGVNGLQAGVIFKANL